MGKGGGGGENVAVFILELDMHECRKIITKCCIIGVNKFLLIPLILISSQNVTASQDVSMRTLK